MWGDTLPNAVNWYNDFIIYFEDKAEEAPGERDRDPAGYFKPTQKGTYAIGYQTTRQGAFHAPINALANG